MSKTTMIETVNRQPGQNAPAAASTVFTARIWMGWVALCALLLFATASGAQTAAYFSGAYTVTDSSLSNPLAVAVDAKGRVFIVDSGNARLVMDTPNGSGGYTQSVLLNNSTAPGGLNGLRDVAVDPQGNVYVVDQGNIRVLEMTLQSDGVSFNAAVDICNGITCGLNDPTGIAIDKYSNLYIIDPGTVYVTVRPQGNTNANNKSFYLNTGQWNSSTIAVDQGLNVWVNDTESGYDQIIEFVYAGTSDDSGAKIGDYSSLNRLGACFGPAGPQHIVVDAAENVYIGDPSGNQIVKWINTGANTWTFTQFIYPLNGPQGVALDSNGNLFITDDSNNRVLEATNAYLSGQAVANFSALGTVSAGATSSQTFTLGFTFRGSGEILAPTVSNGDFTIASSTCAATTYSAGNTCAATVQFTPQGPGYRTSTVELYGYNSGNSDSYGIATAYLIGQASGSQISLPVTEVVAQTIGLGSDGVTQGHLRGIASNGRTSGDNLYSAVEWGVNNNGELLGEQLSNSLSPGSSAANTFATVGLSAAYPESVAADSGRNIYVVAPDLANTDYGAVYKFNYDALNAVSSAQTIMSNMESVDAEVAEDGAGNLYIADDISGQILRETYNANSYIQSVLAPNPLDMTTPQGVAADPLGNVYISYGVNGPVYKFANTQGVYSESLFFGNSCVQGMVLDAFDNLYAPDVCNGNLYKISPSGSQSTVKNGANDAAVYAAIDPWQNLLIADAANERILREVTSTGALNLGNVDLSEQDVTGSLFLTNTGDESLNFSSIQFPANFPESASASTDCAVGTSIAVGASCTLTASFLPNLVEPQSGSIAVAYDGGRTESFPVSVNVNLPTGITVTPATASIEPNATQQFSALAVNSDSITPNIGNYVTWASSNTAAATVSATGLVTAVAPGTTNITATYGNIVSNSATLTVKMIPTTTTLSALTTTATYGTTLDFTVSVTATGGPTLNGSGVFFFDGATMLTMSSVSNDGVNYTYATTSPLPAGKNVIMVEYTGTPLYSSSTSATVTVTVSKATQTITFPTVTGTQYAASTLALSATASSGLPVTFLSDSTAVCTISGTTVTYLQQGTCIPRAYQAGNSNYDVAPMVQQLIPVKLAPQTITFPVPAGEQYALTPVQLTATASSGLPITYASITPDYCTVSGSVATPLQQGSCFVHASQPGNNTYSIAPLVTQYFTIHPAPQTITFPAITAPQYILGTLDLSATASSGLTVAFASATPAVCTVSGVVATMKALGDCVIHATQAGNKTVYAVAPLVSQSFIVHLNPQTITFPAITGTQYVNQMVTLSATSSSGLVVTYASTTPTVCDATGNPKMYLLNQAGSCVIQATQAGNADYAAATMVPQSFVISLNPPTITWPTITGTQYPNTTLALSATVNTTQAITFASTTPTVCTVSGTTASLLVIGTCKLTASVAATNVYAAATVQQSITVAGLPQTITFPAVAAQVVGDTVTLGATASSGLAVTYTSATTAVCTISGSVVTMVTSGACVIHATQTGDALYAGAPLVSKDITVTGMAQTISFPAITATPTATQTQSFSATASSSLAVSFASTTPAVCTVSGTTASLLTAGTCTVQATQAGNAYYAAAPAVNQSFSVSLASQTITVPFEASQTAGTTLYIDNGVSISSSGLGVTTTSTTPSICTVTLTGYTAISVAIYFAAPGTCVLDLNQAGNATYAPAPQVVVDVNVT